MNNTERNILVTKSLHYILNEPLGINLKKWNYQLLKILEIFCPFALQKVCVSVCRPCLSASISVSLCLPTSGLLGRVCFYASRGLVTQMEIGSR